MFTCPACEQPINSASEICPYCGVDLAPEPKATRRNAQRKGLIYTLIGAMVLVGVVWGMVWLVLPKPDVPARAQAESGAIGALREAAQVLTAYQGRQGTYPNTIEQVGSQAAPAYAMARSDGYSLIYRPARPEGDGNIHTFVLLARPEYYGYRNFYIDQSGVVRATDENRAATARDRPIP
ncbi:MAG TPA: hypothetical protein VNJ52_08450 [Patescibacteria group bacterium]|nr:hypothetical protein [Patescibacteria group bacterium]